MISSDKVSAPTNARPAKGGWQALESLYINKGICRATDYATQKSITVWKKRLTGGFKKYKTYSNKPLSQLTLTAPLSRGAYRIR